MSKQRKKRRRAQRLSRSSNAPEQLQPQEQVENVSLFPKHFVLFSLLAVALGAAIYVPAFDAPFVFDSIPQIEQNENLQSLTEGKWFRGRRWLVYLSFAIDRSVFGNTAWGFHLTNLVIHIINSLLIFWLSLILAKRLGHAVSNELSDQWLATFVALIWLVHPLQTQAVIYHVQRMESLMALFFLVGLLCISRINSERKRSWWWLVSATTAGLASMQCKEVGYVFPMVAASLVYVLQARSPISRTGIALAATVAAAFGLVVFLFWLWSPNMTEGQEVPGGQLERSLHYLATQTTIILHYVRLVVFSGRAKFRLWVALPGFVFDRGDSGPVVGRDFRLWTGRNVSEKPCWLVHPGVFSHPCANIEPASNHRLGG